MNLFIKNKMAKENKTETEKQAFERLKDILNKRTSNILYTEKKKFWQEGYMGWQEEINDVVEYTYYYSGEERSQAFEELKMLKNHCLDEAVKKEILNLPEIQREKSSKRI